MQNLHRIFDRYYIGQIFGGDFAKFCGLLRMYELYQKVYVNGLLVALQKKVDNSKIPNNVQSATQKLRSKQQQHQKESFNA